MTDDERRKSAKTHITTDTRKQSQLLEDLDLEGSYRPIVDPGGLVLFAGAHLHSTVPNTSRWARFSIDFRTVHEHEPDPRNLFR